MPHVLQTGLPVIFKLDYLIVRDHSYIWYSIVINEKPPCMKKIFLVSQLFLIALLAYIPQSTFADQSSHPRTSNPGTGGTVVEKLHHEFQGSFPDAGQVNWQETKDQYVVSFIDAGVFNRIIYNKQGEFLSSFRNYGEKGLPYYLVRSLDKSFPGAKIFGVTEITSATGITYFVKLEQSRRWVTVHLDSEGEAIVVESYKKAA